MIYARVELHKDRTKEGRITLSTGESYRCLGKSDGAAAAAHGNPTRDPLKVFGDLPTGEFNAVRSAPKAVDARSYGPGSVWVLNPMSGQALQAMYNGRYGLLIHGGATGAPMPPNALRPTHGCLRVDDSTIQDFEAKVGSDKFTVIVVEVDSPAVIS